MQVEQLTKDWSECWWDKRALLEQYRVDINQDRAGVQIHSLQPHLISLEPDILSTGVTIYHLQVLILLVLSFVLRSRLMRLDLSNIIIFLYTLLYLNSLLSN